MVSEPVARLPDFYVVGAQKSGTSSLVSLLEQSPDIFVCTPREPMFWCRDDAEVHPHTFAGASNVWRDFDYVGKRSELVARYSSLFKSATKEQLVGESSNTYLIAEKVPQRLAELTPQAKLIVMLRNPIDRAYSAYFHHLQRFRIMYSFENQLRYEPGWLLKTGHYYHHLQRFLRYFAREQILVVPFEQFRSEREQWSTRVCQFLGLRHACDPHQTRVVNAARTPRSITLQYVLNASVRLVNGNLEGSGVYADPGTARHRISSTGTRHVSRAVELALRGVGRLNLRAAPYPPMAPETRSLLKEYFRRENKGLSELTGIDFTNWWPEFETL